MEKKSEKKSFLDSFKIDSRVSCLKAIKNGGIAALISAGITLAFGIAGFFTSSDNQALNYMLDPLLLVDVAVIVVLGIFIFLKSRTAATILVIYFVLGKVLMCYELGKPTGVLMSVIFFLYYVTAMRATYIWHSKYRNAPEESPVEQPLA